MTENTVILPCPFCGSGGVLVAGERFDAYAVVCSSRSHCPVDWVARDCDPRSAVARWNIRVKEATNG